MSSKYAIFVLQNNRDMNVINVTDLNNVIKGITKILKGYKGVEVLDVKLYESSYDKSFWAFICTDGITQRQMKLASIKILKKYKMVGATHFEGGWLNYIYSRETLKRAE